MKTETLVAAVSAFIASVALLATMFEARKRSTFEHLRIIDDRLQEMWRHNRRSAQAEVLDYFAGRALTLKAPAIAYLGYLNALDLLALARRRGALSTTITDEYIRPQVRDESGSVTIAYLRELQSECDDPKIYSDLVWYIEWLKYTAHLTWD